MFSSIIHTSILLLLATLGLAFSNTSPLVIISNQRQLSRPALENGEDVSFSMTSLLGNLENSLECHYDAYIFVSQQGLTESNISKSTTPKLMEMVSKAESVLQYPSLIQAKVAESGNSPIEEVSKLIASKCAAERITIDSKKDDKIAYEDTQPRVILAQLDSSVSLASNDKYLHEVIHSLPSGNFVVVYTGSQASSSTEDKIDISTTTDGNNTFVPDDSSLFARYQYFSPGIFMSTIVPLLMIYILVVALGWLSDLKISFGSFEPKK